MEDETYTIGKSKCVKTDILSTLSLEEHVGDLIHTKAISFPSVRTKIVKVNRSDPYRGTTNSQSNTSTDTDNTSGEDLCAVRWSVCRTNVGTHGNNSEDLFQDAELETLTKNRKRGVFSHTRYAGRLPYKLTKGVTTNGVTPPKSV